MVRPLERAFDAAAGRPRSACPRCGDRQLPGELLVVLEDGDELFNCPECHRFRGPNGSGIAQTTGLPVEFGPEHNVIWKTSLPPGHSSPVLTHNRIFVTAFEGDKLLTFCLDRKDGKILWRRESPRSRVDKLDRRNSPASPSPATDGEKVYVFFADYGLLSYDLEGNKIWQLCNLRQQISF